MAFCTNCGAELKEGTNFCTNCGARVAPPPEDPTPETQAPETPATEDPTPEIPATEDPVPESQIPESQIPESQIPESQMPAAGEPEPPEPEAPARKGRPSRRTLIIAAIALLVVIAGAATAAFVVGQQAKKGAREEQTALWLDYGEQTAQWLADMDVRQGRLILTPQEETDLKAAVDQIEADLALELDWDSADSPEEAQLAAQEAIEKQKQALEGRVEDIRRANEGQVNTLRAQLEGEDLSWAMDSDLSQIETLRQEVDGKLADGDYRAAWTALGQWQDVALRAAAPQGFTVSVRQYDLSAYPTVRAYLDVTDAGGSFVPGLGQGAFYVNERRSVDGPFTRRTVTNAAQINEQSGISIGLIADVSGSMYGSIDQAKAVMRSFMGTVQFDKGDEVELLEFADTSYICNTFTSSYSDIVNSINAMSANGGTRLYDTLISEIERIPTRSNAKCIIGFTDGYDNRSVHTAQDVIDAANGYRIPVFLVGVGSGCDESSLRRISEGTGGFYRSISDIGGLESIYNAIYRQAKELYLVEFELEDGSNFDELCYLDFQVRSDDGRGGVVSGYAVEPGDFFELMYNKFLVACMDCQTKGERNLLESGIITTNSESYSNHNCLAWQSEETIRTNGPGSDNANIFEVLTNYEVLEVRKDGEGYILYGLCEFDVSQEKTYSRCREKEKEVIAAQYGADISSDATFWIEESIYNYEKLTLIRDTDGQWKFHTRVYERPSGSGSAYGINEVYKVYMQ